MRRILLTPVLLLFLFSSCIVSKKKYDDLLAQKVRMEADLAERDAQLTKLDTDLQHLDEEIKKLKDDTTNVGIDLRNANQKLSALEKEHEQLNSYYKNL